MAQASRACVVRQRGQDQAPDHGLYIFLKHRAIYVYFNKRKYSIKVNIDGSVIKKYTNWDKLILTEQEETKTKYSAPW